MSAQHRQQRHYLSAANPKSKSACASFYLKCNHFEVSVVVLISRTTKFYVQEVLKILVLLSNFSRNGFTEASLLRYLHDCEETPPAKKLAALVTLIERRIYLIRGQKVMIDSDRTARPMT